MKIPTKKKYSLDYNIERDTDRLAAIVDILDQLDADPNQTDLEQMASYILYGKDENGQNAIKRGECTDADRRYSTFKRASEKEQSLDALLENPLTDSQSLQPYDKRNIYIKKVREIRRPKYDKAGILIDPGDSDVPGMQELWDRIDYLERVLAANEGKIPFDDTMTIVANDYRLYQLRHQIIDMRRHQYYLKDSYKPYIYFLNVKPPQPQSINFDEDTFYWLSFAQWRRKVAQELNPFISHNLRDYESRFVNGRYQFKWVVRHQRFDWEDPRHINVLLHNYSAIYMQNWDKLNSWGRALIFDFDRYVDLANFTPVRELMITKHIDKVSNVIIADEIRLQFGLNYNDSHLSNVINKEIPKQIAAGAKRHKLLLETPRSECKRCFRCKRWLPKDKLFFGINRNRKDGWASNCKECERKRRIERGEQQEYDRRYKDAALFEVQTGKTNT